ncbi:MAG: hypothetical protein FWD32_02335 [Firmicutes bacterium]|nr:hypothetical protein [Bacillota bacterium]
MAKQKKEKPKMVATFPHMGSYYVVFEVLLKRIYKNITVIVPPPISAKTLEIGSLHSPDFVCVPFKYTMGSLMEVLDKGVTHIFQASNACGCRVDFYSELQKELLKDKGYNLKFITPFHDQKLKIFKVIKIIRSAGKTVNIFSLGNSALAILKMIECIDIVEDYTRKNVGFEVEPNSFAKLNKEYLDQIKTAKTIFGVKKIHKKYFELFKAIPLNKPEKPIKVLCVGEIFCVADPAANYFIEKQLAKYNIEVHRPATLTHALSAGDYKNKQRELKVASDRGYLKYDTGSDGSVPYSIEAAEAGFDGVVHLKPFGCILEVNAMPTMIKISADYKMPILFFSLDSQANTTSMKTRLEAFYDMIKMKKEKEGTL